jgi:hypothetical protein
MNSIYPLLTVSATPHLQTKIERDQEATFDV